MDSVPYTERRNPKTTNVDIDTPEGKRRQLINVVLKCLFILGIVDSLHECNLEVFDGYENNKVNICCRKFRVDETFILGFI